MEDCDVNEGLKIRSCDDGGEKARERGVRVVYKCVRNGNGVEMVIGANGKTVRAFERLPQLFLTVRFAHVHFKILSKTKERDNLLWPVRSG